ncbi:LLM class flavin-dependent oxidoreductase [Pseudarthrobacter sp. IC2-21]|uniref:LLM class flavin-dependent oxidoreductase n=1 Tax=Pseudarthrobacter sp. IC2-21 TaxID=3092262 RepID=UPI002A6A94D6|nr:LLM class flavin-dependent oxidoreductase [Pseudarthrobacter sp. IC2-21]
MEIGAYSFGDTQRNPNGSLRSTTEAIRNLHEAIVLADRNGLDYFGIGKHHTLDMPASSPGTVVAAAAAATKRIKLGSGASIISTDDPVRVFQQFAIADAVSGGGRVEITAGRGSSVETFPLFGYDLKDYDRLYAEKLDLLMTINNSKTESVTWSGTVRPALHDLAVVPRPVKGRLPLWLATGGSAPSSVRAGELGLPISYGIIGGAPSRFAPLADLYRASAAKAGHTAEDIKVSVATLGLIAPTKKEALERFYPGWYNLNIEMGKLRGWPAPDKRQFLAQAEFPGAYYVGDPDEIAQRIVDLHGHMGHMRHFLQMDIGSLPHDHFLESLTLLATEVKPRVERLLKKP